MVAAVAMPYAVTCSSQRSVRFIKKAQKRAPKENTSTESRTQVPLAAEMPHKVWRGGSLHCPSTFAESALHFGARATEGKESKEQIKGAAGTGCIAKWRGTAVSICQCLRRQLLHITLASVTHTSKIVWATATWRRLQG